MLDFILRKKEESERIKESFSCSHPHTILTKYTCSNGSVQFVMQCEDCKARVGNPIKHSKLKYWQRKNAPAFDSDGRSNRREEQTAQFKMHRERFNSAAWWAEYSKYLESDEWKTKRARVLVRDNYECTEQRDGCTVRATEVHHLTYANVGNEPMNDLTSVCHGCHEQITNEARTTWRTM